MSVQSPQPLYDPTKSKAAFELRYTWTDWPSQGQFEHVPPDSLNGLKPFLLRDEIFFTHETSSRGPQETGWVSRQYWPVICRCHPDEPDGERPTRRTRKMGK